MPKILHLTDIHLNFVHPEKFLSFCNKINISGGDYIILTGDISEAPTIHEHLKLLEQYINIPIFFVLGNHDYYYGTIEDVRVDMKTHFSFNKNIEPNAAYWLSDCDFISLTDEVAVVGHDGWYDGGYANWFTSNVMMSDYQVINNFKFYWHEEHYNMIRNLAGEAGNHIRRVLPLAFEKHEHVFLGTHVPPYKENSVYMGKVSNDDWLPHFSSKLMGDAILDVMTEYPNKTLTVLCGHSHGSATHKPLPNVAVVTGDARYRYPKISGIYSF